MKNSLIYIINILFAVHFPVNKQIPWGWDELILSLAAIELLLASLSDWMDY